MGQPQHDHDAPIPDRLPILPLLSTVLFPTGVTALQLAEPRSLALLDDLDDGPDVIGLFCCRSDGREIQASDLQEVGVAARVLQRLRLGPSRQQILCHGLRRIALESLDQTEPYMLGSVSVPSEPKPPRAVEADALMGRAIESFRQLTVADPRYSLESVDVLRMNLDAGIGQFTDLLGSMLNVSLEEKRKLIGMSRPIDRLHYNLDLIDRELARVSVEHDIDAQVRVTIEEKKREYHLREQLKVIQEALGEAHSPKREAEEYAAIAEHLPLDDDSKAVVQREIDRLSVMSISSNDYPAQSHYLETLLGLPWWERTEDQLAIRQVERVLAKRHFGLDEVKERLVEYLAVVKLKGAISGPILCLAGPPGTGKTSISRSIADAIGRKFVRISLGGISDESEIRGHRKTYVGAMPGKIIAAYEKVGSRNPVILLDEIDKLTRGTHGDPAAALLEVLDPEQNNSFLDHYLGVPFDLSETLFIATANVLDTIPTALRDRLEILTIPGYTEEEKIEIARRFIRPKLLEAHGLDAKALTVGRNALVAMIRGYTAEAGVRELERQMARICRKVARRRAASQAKKPGGTRVSASNVDRFLGPRRFNQEFANREPEIGVSTGLAWTGAGGSILFVEATRMTGSGAAKITGHLGEVMRESVETALSYVRTHSRALDIDPTSFREHDLHIHFPAGSIPKDGPSAGVAIATCLASLFSGRPVRHDVAMTGEITLRGKLLSVGGIREKVLAAHHAQIKTIILPMGNRRELTRVSEEIRSEVDIRFVDRVEEVWELALIPGEAGAGSQAEEIASSSPDLSKMAAKV